VLDIFERGFFFLPRLALNLNPPDLCLQSSKSYRCGSPGALPFASFLMITPGSESVPHFLSHTHTDARL
jgi:hypothetical protein